MVKRTEGWKQQSFKDKKSLND